MSRLSISISHFSAYDLLTRVPRGVSHDTSSQLMSSSLAVVALKVMEIGSFSEAGQ